jgi:serine/threonine protein phosphatase 1
MKKLYVIGDIHGCHVPLQELLAKISPDPIRDRVIFLGDYINRGPDSKKVITALIEMKKNVPRTIFLKGNHEDMFLRYLRGLGDSPFLQAGGLTTLQSYGVIAPDVGRILRAVPESHYQFFMSLLPYWEEDNYVFVHAGIEQGRHLTLQTAEWLYWADRDSFMRQDFPGLQGVIFGHFVQEKPLIMANKVGIDCGAVYGGNLACLVLPDMEFIAVKSAEYWPVATLSSNDA